MTFAAEMRRWGVKHLFRLDRRVRGCTAGSGLFTERWRGGLWSEFELGDADTRDVITPTGSGRLSALDFFGGNVELVDVTAGSRVVVRTNYYPAWQAENGRPGVRLYAFDGQLAFDAPNSGSYTVRLAYPRYYWLSVLAFCAALAGFWVMSRM